MNSSSSLQISNTTKSISPPESNAVYIESFLGELNELRKEEKFTDVALVCNGVRLPAHKIMLISSCPYFKAMFSGSFVEAHSDVQLGDDNNLEAWKCMLDFIYTGQLLPSLDNVESLLEIALYLQLQSAIEICLQRMYDTLSADNCLAYLCLGQLHNLETIVAKAKVYAITHLEEVIKTKSFLDISAEQIFSILKVDVLQLHTSDALLLGLERWATHRLADRVAALAPILRHLEPRGFSNRTVAGMELLQQDPSTQAWQRDLLSRPEPVREWRMYTLEVESDAYNPTINCYDSSCKTVYPLPSLQGIVNLALHGDHLFAQGLDVTYCRRDNESGWCGLAKPLLKRTKTSLIALEGGLYTIGGNILFDASNAVERLDLVTGVPHFRAPLRKARCCSGFCVADGCIFIVNGENVTSRVRSIERFDPREGIWSKHPSRRMGYNRCVAIGHRLYIMEFDSSSIYVWDTRTTTWDEIVLPMTCSVDQMAIMDQKIYINSAHDKGIMTIDLDDGCRMEQLVRPQENLEYLAIAAGIVTL